MFGQFVRNGAPAAATLLMGGGLLASQRVAYSDSTSDKIDNILAVRSIKLQWMTLCVHVYY
jgi:hypothetical protein